MSDPSLVLPDSLIQEDLAPDSSRRIERTHSHAMCAMRFDLGWHSDGVAHVDCRVLPKMNLWRDIFPPVLESQLMDVPVGTEVGHLFAAGELMPNYNTGDCVQIDPNQFNRRYRKGNFVEPRVGRFYPKGFIAGVKGIFVGDIAPFRVGAVDERLTVDLNHPLAGRELHLNCQVLDIWSAGDEHGGSCNEVGELITIGGPGMQARWRDQPTDFWSDIPFIRMATDADAAFYQKARLVDHMDATATRQVESLYARLIPKGSEVLDLMASWKSHLSADLELSAIAGLGMNQDELDANPLLSERLVHDLNLYPVLPYDDNRFDAVVCTVSVEYLIRPFEVFAEVNRVLKPGGRFIVTFSNRWFPPKVVSIWSSCHEFERPGIVLEYFHKVGGFTNLNTWSIRGLPRPVDDKYAGQSVQSDPVYAVWGEKSG